MRAISTESSGPRAGRSQAPCSQSVRGADARGREERARERRVRGGPPAQVAGRSMVRARTDHPGRAGSSTRPPSARLLRPERLPRGDQLLGPRRRLALRLRLPADTYGFTYPPFAALVMMPMALRRGTSRSWSAASPAWSPPWCSSTGWSTRSPGASAGSAGTRSGWRRARDRVRAAAGDLPVRPGQHATWSSWSRRTCSSCCRPGQPVHRGRHRPGHRDQADPGLFIIYLLVTRRWRAAVIAVGTAAAATRARGGDRAGASRVFWTDALWNTDRIGTVAFISNQSLNGAVARLNPRRPEHGALAGSRSS